MLQSRVTHILISQPNQRNSEKFIAAVRCRKECLMIDWVTDSVSKGYALPYINYRIYTGQPSTDTILNSTQMLNMSTKSNAFHADGTQLSVIMNDFSIAETTPRKSGSQCNNFKDTLDKTDINVMKTAKGCIDGCTVS